MTISSDDNGITAAKKCTDVRSLVEGKADDGAIDQSKATCKLCKLQDRLSNAGAIQKLRVQVGWNAIPLPGITNAPTLALSSSNDMKALYRPYTNHVPDSGYQNASADTIAS